MSAETFESAGGGVGGTHVAAEGAAQAVRLATRVPERRMTEVLRIGRDVQCLPCLSCIRTRVPVLRSVLSSLKAS